MFSKTYRTTLKTIIRSPLTWVAAAFMIGAALYFVLIGSYANYDISTGELIMDSDKRFVLMYGQYIQKVFNTIRRDIMLFGGPAFFVIVSGIVLTRDWHDNFFEIEHAGGVRSLPYFLGRFFAVFTFLTVSALVTYLFSFHLYIVTRGGVPGLAPWEYVIDSNVRLLREFCITGIPGILIFMAVTFLIGNLAKNGTIGTIAGIAYVLFEYLTKTFLNFRMPQFYHDYLTPTPSCLYRYWAYYDTEWFDVKWPHNPFTMKQMLLCLLSLFLIALVCSVVSYICVKKRKV